MNTFTVGSKVTVYIKTANSTMWQVGTVDKVTAKWLHLTDCYRSADRWVLRENIIGASVVPDYSGTVITTQCY